MIAAFLIALPLAAYDVAWTAPKVYVAGRPFRTHVEITVTAKTDVPTGLFEPGAFTIDGKPIEERKQQGKIQSAAGSVLKVDLDIGPAIAASKAFGKKDFKLGFMGGDGKPVDVLVFVPAGKGLDFMDEKKMPAADLAKSHVLIETNRGQMLVELWPDVAPNHVRNFLDLAYEGFYDETLFHRVGPGFMIQGGDPTTKDPKRMAEWGTGQGPREVAAEFSAKKHVRGVLSMARGDDPNSATSQFFVMDAPNPGLDGKYSAFGLVIDGVETVEKIAASPGQPIDARTVRPNEPQKILKATVLESP